MSCTTAVMLQDRLNDIERNICDGIVFRQELNEAYALADELKSENAELREELEQWHKLTAGIELPEYPITQFQPKDLERENAKLRKLVQRMWPVFIGEKRATFADRLHVRAEIDELGIEVDE